MLHDPWLERWLPLLAARISNRPILEIGCGTGDDTATLVEAGFAVVAFDLSPTSAAATQARVPEARVSCQDVRAPFPLGDREAGAIVASQRGHQVMLIVSEKPIDKTAVAGHEKDFRIETQAAVGLPSPLLSPRLLRFFTGGLRSVTAAAPGLTSAGPATPRPSPIRRTVGRPRRPWPAARAAVSRWLPSRT